MNRKKPYVHSSVSRRDVLALLGAAGAGLTWGSAGAKGSAVPPGAPGNASDREDVDCTLTPKQTEGPYYVDEALQRSDIRTDTSDGSAKPGVPLAITLRVHGSSAGRCTPLADAVVDIWHCDASGIYSDVSDPRNNTVGKTFLRGHQVTDSNGEVRFKTIFPGRYSFRATHIHLKVRQKRGSPSRRGAEAEKPLNRQEFTTQLYFDEAITEAVYAHPPYAGKVQGGITNKSDFLFNRGGGPQLILPLTEIGDGYSGIYKLAIEL